MKELKARATLLLFFFLTTSIAILFIHATGTGDVRTWLRWIDSMEKYGLIGGYVKTQPLYPPLSFVLLDSVGRLSALFHLDVFNGIKLSLLLFLLFTSATIYFYTKNLFLTSLLQLSLILNSVALGYLDVYFAPFLILSLWSLQKRRLIPFAILFAVSFLIKPQPLIIVPFLVAYLANVNSLKSFREINFRELLFRIALPVLLICLALFLAFGLAFPLSYVGLLGYSSVYLSGYALNLNWIYTFFLSLLNPAKFNPLVGGQVHLIKNVDLSVTIFPQVIFTVVYITIFIRFFRKTKTFQNLLLYSLLGSLAYFMLNTGVHENLLFLPTILSALLLFLDLRYLYSFVVWSVAANVNLLAFYGVDGRGLPFSHVVAGFDLTVLLAALNLALFLSFLIQALFRAQTYQAAECSYVAQASEAHEGADGELDPKGS